MPCTPTQARGSAPRRTGNSNNCWMKLQSCGAGLKCWLWGMTVPMNTPSSSSIRDWSKRENNNLQLFRPLYSASGSITAALRTAHPYYACSINKSASSGMLSSCLTAEYGFCQRRGSDPGKFILGRRRSVIFLYLHAVTLVALGSSMLAGKCLRTLVDDPDCLHPA